MAATATTRNRTALFVLLGVVLCAVAYLIYRQSRSSIVVRTAALERSNLSMPVYTNGKVEPESDFQPHAPTSGVVEKVFVKLGQNVGMGQQLLRLDASDAQSRISAAQATLQSSQATLQNMQHGGTQDELLAEKADLAAARTQLTQATASYTALDNLQVKGAASANEVAAARQRAAEAQARVAQLEARGKGRYGATDLATSQAQVAQARSALFAARSDYGGVDIRAPFQGTVYSLPVAQYDFVQQGEALVNLANLSRLRIRAYFDEPEIGKLANGQPVEVKWDAKPTQVWHGHISQAPTTIITYGTRNVGECLISVDDAKGDLLPNTNVTVTVTTSQRSNVLSLPREALHTEGGSDFVYRIVAGRLTQTPVKVGVSNLTRFEVLSGLQQGEVVVLGATTPVELTDGLRVEPQI